MLPISRIVLYKHGVGYFERRGSVEGDATIELEFKQAEMNDVLKSLTVTDLGGGTVPGISYESAASFPKQLEDIGIELPDKKVLSGLMRELKGARAAITVAGKVVEGVILGVESVTRRHGETVLTDHRLALLVDGQQVQSFDLLELQAVSFLDEKIRKDLVHLLETLITAKKKQIKRLSICARGEGKRELQVGYLLEVPVWKTSYRILLSKQNKPIVQGWALVDNTQEEDWEEVRLSLIAGLPVSFVHELYSPRYQRRPVLEVEQEEAYGPPVMEEPEAMAELVVEEGEGEEPQLAMLASPVGAVRAMRARAMRPGVLKRTIEAGDLCAYELENPVTVRRGRSALVPLFSEPFEGRRVAVYNPQVREKNPMAAVLLRNTTAMTLEAGPVTVIEDDDYVGESMLQTLKAGDEKLLPYSVELGCVVSVDPESTTHSVYRATISEGVLTLHSYRISRATYVINNKSDRGLDLFLEHRFRRGWELIETPDPIERTENFYRFRLEAPARSQKKFDVRERLSEPTAHELTRITDEQLGGFVKAKYLDERTEAALRELTELQGEVAAVDRRSKQSARTREAIFKNQERLRENLRVLGTRQEETELRQRYVKELTEQEDRLQALDRELEELHRQEQELKASLSKKLKLLHYDATMSRPV